MQGEGEQGDQINCGFLMVGKQKATGWIFAVTEIYGSFAVDFIGTGVQLCGSKAIWNCHKRVSLNVTLERWALLVTQHMKSWPHCFALYLHVAQLSAWVFKYKKDSMA